MSIFSPAKPTPKRNPRRVRYAIKASVSEAEYDALWEQCDLRGCTMADLIRGALRLDEPTRQRPLLVCAGQLLRAGNARAVAFARNDHGTAIVYDQEMKRLAAQLITLAIEEGELR